MSISTNITKILAWADKRSPQLLVGFGISSLLVGVITSIRATIKSVRDVDEYICAMDTELEDLTKKEVIKVCWKNYILPTTTIIAGVSAIIAGQHVSHKRSTALVTAYSVSETALKEYREAVRSTDGEKKDREYRDKIAKKKLDENVSGDIIQTGTGTTPCMDAFTGRKFYGNIDKLRRVASDLTVRLYDEHFICLNDWYYEIGLDGVKDGEDLGWQLDNGRIEIDLTPQLDIEENPIVVVSFTISPKHVNWV